MLRFGVASDDAADQELDELSVQLGNWWLASQHHVLQEGLGRLRIQPLEL
jgi:hypothetical protein